MNNESTGDPAAPPPAGTVVEVRSCKYDGRVNRRWQAEVVGRRGPLFVLRGVFADEVRHNLLGTIEAGTVSTEYYWTDRCYSIFRFVTPAGRLRNFYGNINLPPTFAGPVMSFTDLDIDVLVAPDYSYSVLDEDEFAANAARFPYPADVQALTRAALTELIALIEERKFPLTEDADHV